MSNLSRLHPCTPGLARMISSDPRQGPVAKPNCSVTNPIRAPSAMKWQMGPVQERQIETQGIRRASDRQSPGSSAIPAAKPEKHAASARRAPID